MRLTRRSFLKASATVGTAGATGVGIVPRLAVADRHEAAGEERWVPGVCLQCPAGCGLLVRVVGGRAVKIEGNPLHPINEGRLCPKGQIGLQILYDPDRIRGPMRRAGERGAGQWQSISWDEALGLLADRLRTLRGRGEPHRLVIMSGRNRGQMGALLDRFAAAFGTPNHVGHSSICADGSKLGHYLTQGFKHYAGYDWDNTNYILCFGGAFLEAWRPTVRLLRAYGHLRRGRPVRGKLVQVDTRFSITAAKADEWISINPGTDGALALGIAHVIVLDGLYDRAFIAEHTFGFEDWTDERKQAHRGFRRLVLEDYPPEKVARITGVPQDVIVRVAREFATTRPAVAAGERGSSMQTNGIYARMAIHALNALVGSVDTPGGILVQKDPPFVKWPDVVKDDITETGGKQPRIDRAGTARFPLAANVYAHLPEAILAKDPYSVDTVMLYYTNPLFSSPNVERYYEAFKQVPFIVTFSPFMDETTAMADLVLPDHTYLERWQDDAIYPSLGYPVWAIRQPVVEPLHNTRNAGDVLLEVARRLGGSVAQSFPWKTFLDVIQFRARGIWESGKGSFAAPDFPAWWKEFTRRGVWTNPPYTFGEWERVLKTPSGKFEFFSQALQHKFEEMAEKEAEEKGTAPGEALEGVLKGLKIEARGALVYQPHYEPIRHVGDPKEYPFVLVTYKLMAHAEGRGGNVPNLQEMLGPHVRQRWRGWAEVNPRMAASLGIRDGDWIWVESPVGKIKTQARVYPGARPDVVAMPFELGHRAYGRWARGRGANPNEITANEYDFLGGNAAWFSTRVRIYRA